MDNQRSSNLPPKSAHHHTIEGNTTSTMPHFDYVLPSYRRDRRVSSVTSAVLPETIIEEVLTTEQNPSSSETANTVKG